MQLTAAAPTTPAADLSAEPGLPGRGARRASTIFALPSDLPAVPELRTSGFSSRDMTPTVFVGRLTDGREDTTIVGYESLAQRGVNGGFAEALAAARELAASRPEGVTRYLDGDPLKPGLPKEGDDPARWQQLGTTTPTGVAAVLQAKDGSLCVAPAFEKTFQDDRAFDTRGFDLRVATDDGFPFVAEGHSREIVALVGEANWADLRHEPAERGVV